jgi:hypothetical protein
MQSKKLAQPCSAALKDYVNDFCGRVEHVVGMTERDIRDLSQNYEGLLFGPVCIFAAVFATVLLIVSTIKYNDTIAPWLFWTVTIVGILPLIGLIGINYIMTRYLRRYRHRVHENHEKQCQVLRTQVEKSK